MARVNLIPPHLLTDQHLLAERYEINMIAGCFVKSMKSKKGVDLKTLPTQYNLNEHHIKFFYNKRSYLQHRYDIISEELIKRKYNLNAHFKDRWSELGVNDNEHNVLFVPTRRDYEIIIERIIQRIGLKPLWYTFYDEVIDFTEYKLTLLNFLNQQ